MGRKCKFQSDWLNEEEEDENGDKLVHYFIPHKDNIHAALCTVCSKTVSVTSMGKAALIQHARGDIHKEKMKIKKGLSTQRKLTFQKKDSSDTNDAPGQDTPEVEVENETEDTTRSTSFTISVTKDPTKLTEPHSQQASLTTVYIFFA